MSPTTAQVRATHRLIDLSHALLYLCPEGKDAYAGAGLEPLGQGYVAGRAAPMGPVGPGVSAAVFYNFSPALHQYALPAAWEIATPDQLLAARAAAIEAAYTRVEVPTDGLAELTELAQRAADGADLAGRPLAAANAGVPLPGTPYADSWQALTVLREHRGDAHVAVLLTEGVGPIEALVLMAGWQSELSRRFFQASRGWDDEAWDAATASLVDRGLATPEGLTDAGLELREHIEHRTDELSMAPFAHIGGEGTRRMYELLEPVVHAINHNGGFKRPATTLPWPS